MSLFADLVFALPLPRAYTYAVPPEWAAAARPGARARAPLGPKTVTGFIVRVHDQPPAGAVLKPILGVLDPEPVIPPDILALAGRLSRRFYSSWGELLRPAVPPALKGADAVKAALTEAGRSAWAAGALEGEEALVAGRLAARATSPSFFKRQTLFANGPAALARLVRKDFAEVRPAEKPVRKRLRPAAAKPAVQMALDFSLDPSAVAAVAGVADAAADGRFLSRLFVGLPAGRAAAYLACIRGVLAAGRRVLFLYPEIGMSDSVAAALAGGLGERVVLLHSRLTPREREEARRRAEGPDPVVVAGPRSALFTPLAGLGLIIVDEESDESYLQTESPVYDARVGARWRAEAASVPLISGAEAPTVEACERARRDGGLFLLPGPESPVRAVILDDRPEPGLLAGELRRKLAARLAVGKKAVLFARRRGYAAFLLCPRCGHVPRCPRCEIALTLLQKTRRLVCRTCGESRPAPASCPDCGGRILDPRGAGVEAVAEELRRLVPGARPAVFDSETLLTREAREKVLARFAEGAVNVLAATSLLAHQAGVPPVSLVGILNPEQGLGQADFRAGQRSFVEIRRLLRVLDRSDLGAEAFLQTAVPDQVLLRAAAAGDYEAFFRTEIEYRRMLGYPPFAALAEIGLWGGPAPELRNRAAELAAGLRRAGAADVLGPAEIRAGAAKGLHLAVKGVSADELDEILAAVLPAVKGRKTVSRYD